jgi:hypothetical protein
MATRFVLAVGDGAGLESVSRLGEEPAGAELAMALKAA